MYNAKNMMSDFKTIQNGDDILDPEDIRDNNIETMEFLKETIPTLENVIMISHHSPSIKSLPIPPVIKSSPFPP